MYSLEAVMVQIIMCHFLLVKDVEITVWELKLCGVLYF